MKIENRTIEGIKQKVLIVEEGDKSEMCESCGKPFFSHVDLAKEEDDWCINCNDEHYRKAYSDLEMGQWSLNQILNGKILVIATEVKE